jgi:hypothetical protein
MLNALANETNANAARTADPPQAIKSSEPRSSPATSLLFELPDTPNGYHRIATVSFHKMLT